MQLKDLIPYVSQFAPILGEALGGPMGEGVGELIAHAFGGTSKDPQGLLATMQSSSDTMIKLKQIENDYKMQSLKSDDDESASAREMKIEDDKLGKKDYMRGILATLLLTGTFVFMYIILTTTTEAQDDHIVSMVSIWLIFEVTTVFKFYFGGAASTVMGNFFNVK